MGMKASIRMASLVLCRQTGKSWPYLSGCDKRIRISQGCGRWRVYESSVRYLSSEGTIRTSQAKNAKQEEPLASSVTVQVQVPKNVLNMSSIPKEDNRNKSIGIGGSVGKPAITTPPPSTPQNETLPTPPAVVKPPLAPTGRKRVRTFFFFKFFDFVQGYNNIVETKFPGAMNVYRVFTVGVKDFARDLADYVQISTKAFLKPSGMRELTSTELDIYYRMPKEIARVAPTLIISALPFMNYVMFPIAYYFPKRLLSSHFWSLQQKAQFAIDFHKQKLYNYRPVFRGLQANVELVRDPSLRAKCQAVLDRLGSGMHPSHREIMEIKPLFESDPFSLQAIYGPQVKGLCRMHGIHTLYLKRRRLYDTAEVLHAMDAALMRDGIFNLKPDDLKTACFFRGLNAANTSHKDMVEYLQQWCSISNAINIHSYSLLLHLPILLAYNNPNNWALLV